LDLFTESLDVMLRLISGISAVDLDEAVMNKRRQMKREADLSIT